MIDDPRYAIRSLLVNDAALRDLGPAVDAVDPAVPIYVCATEDFLGITGIDIHRGCLALVAHPGALSVAEALAGVTTAIVLEGVTNPDNVGGVFRNAAAFGAGAVILSPTCCDPLYRKAIRTSMAAVLLTPREPSQSIDQWLAGQARRAGQAERARIALLVGTEGAGLSADADAAADVRVRIAMSDAVDSLNLAVAVGIALFALRR